MKTHSPIRWSLTFLLLILPAFCMAGCSVQNGKLLDANGNPFVMRGINHPHTWYTQQTQAIADIAQTGANTARIVLSNGTQWTRNSGTELSTLIQLCKDNKLVCILEVHDSTGYPENSASSHISNATSYWLSNDIKTAIQGQEDYVIINIANEPFGNNVSSATYINDHISAIQSLRNGGITHTLMVDAANWGQDWQFFMRDNASQIFNADTAGNTIFDVHMYEVFNTASKVQSYMQSFSNAGLVLVVGEFGTTHQGSDVDENAIMQYAEQFDFGYIGWSWSGNGSCCTDLDIVSNWNPTSLSNWGTRLINGTNGISQTSQIASVYGEGNNGGGGTTEICIWHDNTEWPLCATDVGGWGWENNQSCISHSVCPGTTSPDPNCTWHDGNEWPLCTVDVGGWGWENNQSCISQSICPE